MKQHLRTHPKARAAKLAAALLLPVVVATSCEDNAPLFTEIPGLAPLPAGSGGSDDEEFPDLMEAPDASSGGASGNGGVSDPGDAGGGGSDDDPAGAGGTLDGGAGTDEPGAGAGGGSEPPPNDDSCGAQCVRNGGRCDDGTCFFDCEAPDSCAVDQVLCPPGTQCEVRCGTRACVNNVVCGAFATCNILCEGELSCASEIICEGDCDVTCSGTRSCRGGTGGSVQLMELVCSGNQSCGATVQCEGVECRLECSGPQSCARVRTFASENTLRCSGSGSCSSEITCLGVDCEVECGNNACTNGIDCRALDCDLPEEFEDEVDD